MKTLRYLLIVMAMLSVLSVSAQKLAQRPEIPMRSTSGIELSGTTLPMAAQQGIVVTGSTPGTYTPYTPDGGPRKGLGGGGESGEPCDRPEPWKDPIGDAMWPLMLLACAYCAFLIIRTRKREVH